MKQVNIALLGMGRIGKIHFKNIEQHFPGVNIALLPILFMMRLSKKNIVTFSFQKMRHEVIALPEVDAILICTPTSSHADLIEKGIQNRKHIFCEKPMDLSTGKNCCVKCNGRRYRHKINAGV